MQVRVQEEGSEGQEGRDEPGGCVGSSSVSSTVLGKLHRLLRLRDGDSRKKLQAQQGM